MLQRVYRARNARARAFPQVREREERVTWGSAYVKPAASSWDAAGFYLMRIGFGLELFVAGFGTFVEAFDDAAELHWRYVRSCRTRCAGEGERVL